MTKPRAYNLLAWAAEQLAAAGIDNPRREARLLLAHHMGRTPEQVIAFPEYPVSDADQFRSLIERRKNREPLSHITGRREFWSMDFEVCRDVLDPRPDSETLVEAVLNALPEKAAALRLVDFGTGSGCLLLAVLSELPNATGVGVDMSEKALAVARRNAERLGLATRCSFIQSDWAEKLEGQFNIVLSNPPYIESADIDGLEPEVAKHEPRLALDGGPDGLAPYRIIIPQAKNILVSEGLIALEFGKGQDLAVTGILDKAGFADITPHQDLTGTIRCLTAKA